MLSLRSASDWKDFDLVGTKEGPPFRERGVAVCENCYAILKQKVRTGSRIGRS